MFSADRQENNLHSLKGIEKLSPGIGPRQGMNWLWWSTSGYLTAKLIWIMWHQLQTLLNIKEQIIEKWTNQYVLSSII